MGQYRLKTKIKRLIFRPIYRRFDEMNARFAEQIEWLKRQLVLNCFFDKKITAEQQEVIDFLKTNKITVFPYDFPEKHHAKDIQVYIDETNQLKYVLHANKRMYFPADWTENMVRDYYNGLLVEQDEKSPHIYETSDFYVHEGDVVADIGAAEGIFGLSIIEKVKKLYLFECEEKWIKALAQTFAPYKEKVEIINKYISDETSNEADKEFITLDDFIQNRELNFIKADIEGAETALLRGAAKILANTTDLRIVLCTYHKQNDEQELKELLEQNGFTTEFSKGYMLYVYDKDFSAPYLRHGLIRGEKRRNFD